MIKAKTSNSSKKSSKLTPSDYALDLKGRAGGRLTRQEAGKQSDNRALVIEALAKCLIDGDDKGFKEVLKAHYEAVNTARALRRALLSPRTYYEAVSDIGNPKLRTIMKLLRGIVN